jgi:hypothetical protein
MYVAGLHGLLAARGPAVWLAVWQPAVLPPKLPEKTLERCNLCAQMRGRERSYVHDDFLRTATDRLAVMQSETNMYIYGTPRATPRRSAQSWRAAFAGHIFPRSFFRS